MNARKFKGFAVQIATELEQRTAGLSAADRGELDRLLGATGGVLRFVQQVKSPELKACGELVKRLFTAGASLAMPMVGIGPDEAGKVVDALLPELATVAPTVATALRALAPGEG